MASILSRPQCVNAATDTCHPAPNIEAINMNKIEPLARLYYRDAFIWLYHVWYSCWINTICMTFERMLWKYGAKLTCDKSTSVGGQRDSIAQSFCGILSAIWIINYSIIDLRCFTRLSSIRTEIKTRYLYHKSFVNAITYLFDLTPC